MEKKKFLSGIVLIILGILFIIYSKLSRKFSIYFFWESGSWGVDLFLMGFLLLAIFQIRKYKKEGKKSVFYKFLAGLIIFILSLDLIITIILSSNNAFEVAKAYVDNNHNLVSDIGTIKGYSFVLSGSISGNSDINGVQHGDAVLDFVVKGNTKYKDVKLVLNKDSTGNWRVIDFN